MKLRLHLPDPEATAALGAALWRLLPDSAVVYLYGDLGAGKTALVRGLLRGAGHAGAVRSPTYTLIEPYELAGRQVHHLDLYRLGDPEELEYVGLRDLVGEPGLLLVEWPERGIGMLPPADLVLRLGHRADGRDAELEAGERLDPEQLGRLVEELR